MTAALVWRRRCIDRLDGYFQVSERGSTFGREALGGATTFAAMSYIVIVNPLILAAAGMDRDGVLVATALSAIVGTLAMALWANLPVALAPGMGSNVVAGAALGTSTVTAFVESVAGVEAGARTGFSGVVVAALFALTLVAGPLIGAVPAEAVAPALVLVGALMLEDVVQIDRSRPERVLPPLLMILFTVCTMDLMAGLAVGCFSATLLAIGLKQWKDVTVTLLALDAIFALYLVLRNAIG